MSDVSAHPSPLYLVLRRRFDGLFPQLEVLDRSRLSLPTSCHPAGNPRAHPFDDVLGVAGEQDAIRIATSRDLPKRLDHGAQGHPVVGGPWLRYPVIAPLHFTGLWMEPLDQATGAAR